MPELPEIEAIRQYLSNHLEDQVVTQVHTSLHTVIRDPSVKDFIKQLTGAQFRDFRRTGKILHITLLRDRIEFEMFFDFGLTGRISWRGEKKKLPAKTVARFVVGNGRELIYHDRRLHGSIWLFRLVQDQTREVPPVIKRFGPDILAIDEMTFQHRAAHYRGEIKSILTNQQFVVGIGNAYADEILFKAQVHPFTKRTQLTDADLVNLFQASHQILTSATTRIFTCLERTDKLDNENVWRKKVFQVHLRGGEPCPTCSRPLRTIKAKRITNFCRNCQPSKNKAFR